MTAIDGFGASGDVAELVGRGELDAAIAQLRAIPARTAAETRYLAWLEQRRGDFDGSARTLDPLLRELPADDEAEALWAHARWLAGDLAGADAALGRISERATLEGGALERIRADLESLREQRASLAPVAGAARRLDVAFAAGITIVGIVTLALMLRAARSLVRT